MKQLMQTQSLGLHYGPDLITQIGCGTVRVNQTGQIMFSHPEGTHDDQLWALAMYITRIHIPTGGTNPTFNRMRWNPTCTR